MEESGGLKVSKIWLKEKKQNKIYFKIRTIFLIIYHVIIEIIIMKDKKKQITILEMLKLVDFKRKVK